VAVSLHVCVCTNRAPAAIAPCLRALATQGAASVTLVLSAVGEAEASAHEEHARQALPAGATVLREPLPGLSRARNRALAEREPEDAIAFVDDDAIVGGGWLEEMHGAWERAGERVACIGGPIRARFDETPRPAWLSDALLPVLTTLDYGPEPLDLDPFRTTVYGANVSFRCGPLRDAGGFDPKLGHGGRPTGFGEEDEAERALARAGWTIRYEPGPWVWHLIPAERLERTAFLRRRLHYGAGLGARRARTPRRATRQLLTSAIGAPIAALHHDEALTMERATRAAENAGVLLAPLLVRR
jgi:GT2 family glycosyltransferase